MITPTAWDYVFTICSMALIFLIVFWFNEKANVGLKKAYDRDRNEASKRLNDFINYAENLSKPIYVDRRVLNWLLWYDVWLSKKEVPNGKS